MITEAHQVISIQMSHFKTYLAVGTVTFVLFVVLFAPARIIWQAFGDEYAAPLVSLSRIEGTVWRGSAILDGEFLKPGKVAWQIKPLDLMTGQLKTHLNIDGSFHQLTTVVSVASNYLQISELSGIIQAGAVNPVIHKYGLQVSGSLDLHDLAFHIQDNWIEQLSGDLEWSGGAVRYSTYRTTDLYELPPLIGDLALQSSEVTLQIKEKDKQLPVLAVRLDRNGWGKVVLRGRLFDLAAQPWPIPGAPDDAVLEVEEKIW